MLFGNEFEIMANDVKRLLKSLPYTIVVLRPKPLAQQTNYDDLLNEFNGAIAYDEIVVHAERMDLQVDSMFVNKSAEKDYGNMSRADYAFKVPNDEYTPDQDDIIAIDTSDKRYRISEARRRVGETILMLNELDRTPAGTQTSYLTNTPIVMP